MEVRERPSASFILTSKPLNASHSIPRLFPSLMSVVCYLWLDELELRAAADVLRLRVRAERGAFIHQRGEQCNRGSKSKADKWLITSRKEMIHHFLILSSSQDCLWGYISVSYTSDHLVCYSESTIEGFD